jgi:Holliday junction resolvase RusA-like endonuclease
MNSFIIDGRLDGLNEYINACRRNKYAANNMKKGNQKVISYFILKALNNGRLHAPSKFPVGLNIVWYEPNNRRDVDNVQFAAKFILDALVEMNVIPDDSRKYVNLINNRVECGREYPRIFVEVIENDEGRSSINDTY